MSDDVEAIEREIIRSIEATHRLAVGTEVRIISRIEKKLHPSLRLPDNKYRISRRVDTPLLGTTYYLEYVNRWFRRDELELA